jgi:hypothetical protein
MSMPKTTQTPAVGTSQAQLKPISLFGTTFAATSAANDTSPASGQVIEGVPTTRPSAHARNHDGVITFTLWPDPPSRPCNCASHTPSRCDIGGHDHDITSGSSTGQSASTTFGVRGRSQARLWSMRSRLPGPPARHAIPEPLPHARIGVARARLRCLKAHWTLRTA